MRSNYPVQSAIQVIVYSELTRYLTQPSGPGIADPVTLSVKAAP